MHGTTIICSNSRYRELHLLYTVSKYGRILVKVYCLSCLARQLSQEEQEEPRKGW